MDARLILETTFVIDLEREAHRGEPGPAHRFLEEHPEAPLAVTLTTAGELAGGPRTGERPSWEELIGRFELLVPDLETAWRYGQTFRYLRDNGNLIGSNDLWIAATGLAHGLAVVTANEAHYRRVPGLDVLGYR